MRQTCCPGERTGGDDYQNCGSTRRSGIIALVGDQGAIITVNGGQT